MNPLLDQVRSRWRAWEKFWFESYALERIRIFRRGLGVLLFVFYSIRSLDLEFFYSEHGVMPQAIMPDLYSFGQRWSLFVWFPENTALWLANTAFLVSLAFLAWGKWPRSAAAVAFVLHVSFLHRNPAIVYGVDLISTFFLFFLALAGERSGSVASMSYRLLQMQVCVIYFYSGVDKLRGTHWWKGDALWYALSNDQIARFDFSFMAGFPLLIALGTYSTVIWELYFPVLVWTRFRIPGLIFGILLHLGIAMSMNIPFFGLLMILSYSLFVSASEIRRVVNGLNKLIKVRDTRAEENSV